MLRLSEVIITSGNSTINVNITGAGPRGLSAYETWLALGNVGTKQQFIDSQFDEPARVTNENTRKQSELTRIANEITREQQETLRQEIFEVNETTRQTNETTRISNEETRQTEETLRQEADILRGQTVEAIEAHYAPRLTSAEEQINTLAEQLEDGTAGIDDNVVSVDRVWSSAKTQTQIQLIPKGEKGNAGLNAYEFWLSQGNTGTMTDFYRQALRIFTVEEGQLPDNPQEGDIIFEVPIYSMPTDYLFRYDAMELVLADNENVLGWQDSSQNGFDLIPKHETRIPKYSATGFNGKPTVKFNGTANEAFKCTNFALDRLDGCTLFIVAKFDVLASATFIDIDGTSGKYSVAAEFSGSSGVIRGILNNQELVQVLISDTSPFLYTHIYDKATTKVYKNSSLNGSANYSVDIIQSNAICVGMIGSLYNGNELNGKISEIVYFSRALTIEERFNTEMYLMRKWGIA